MIQLLNNGVLLVIQGQEAEVVKNSKMLAVLEAERVAFDETHAELTALSVVLQRTRRQVSEIQSRIFGICHKYWQNERTQAAPQEENSLLRCCQKNHCFAPAKTKLRPPQTSGSP